MIFCCLSLCLSSSAPLLSSPFCSSALNQPPHLPSHPHFPLSIFTLPSTNSPPSSPPLSSSFSFFHFPVCNLLTHPFFIFFSSSVFLPPDSSLSLLCLVLLHLTLLLFLSLSSLYFHFPPYYPPSPFPPPPLSPPSNLPFCTSSPSCTPPPFLLYHPLILPLFPALIPLPPPPLLPILFLPFPSPPPLCFTPHPPSSLFFVYPLFLIFFLSFLFILSSCPQSQSLMNSVLFYS